MINLSQYQYIVFDCDGVILDSNSMKTQAFAKAINGEPQEKINLLLLYHKEHGGVSRYHKFTHYVFCLIHSVVTDFGRVMGMPMARLITI